MLIIVLVLVLWFFVLLVYVLYLVCQILQASVGCQFFIAPSFFSNDDYAYAVPDLPLCLGVLKQRAPLAREVGPSSCQKYFFPVDFSLCGAIYNFKICWACMPDCLCRPTGSTSFRAKSKEPVLTSRGPHLCIRVLGVYILPLLLRVFY